MKNNSKKTNKQNTARSIQNTARKLPSKTKDERRRILFNKKYVKRERNQARYGVDSGAALVVAKTSDMNRRLVAAFLAVVFAISCMVVGVNFATRADETVANLTPSSITNKGLVNSKYLTINDSGTYDLTLETYATGGKITEQTPTDFVFVIDQSASMGTNVDIPTGGYSVYHGPNGTDSDVRNYYLPGPNDTLPERYILGTDGNYYRVYAKKGYMYEYHKKDTYHGGNFIDTNNYTWFTNKDIASNEATTYYFNDGTGFYPISINLVGRALRYELRCYYRNSSGNIVQITREDYPIDQYESFAPSLTGNPIKSGFWYKTATTALNVLFPSGDDAWLYGSIGRADASMYISFETYHRHFGYNQLCYRDANGEEHILIDATYCDSDGYALGGAGGTAEGKTSTNDAYWTGTLYTANGHISRLQALQNSLKNFVDSIASQKDSNGPVDHRIAIVGFSGGNDSTYKNTELLTGTSLTITDEAAISSGSSTFVSLDGQAHNGVQKYNATQADYDTALLQTKDGSQKAKIDKAVESITAYGGTQPQDGLEMATKIVESRTIAGDYNDGIRNSVVIFFTDGRPGNNDYSDQYDAANSVVEQAAAVKATNNGKTDIYSIGVFGESDGNPLTYAVSMNSTNATKAEYRQDYLNYANGRAYFKMWFNDNANYTGVENDTIADYMSVVSSNYPNAKKFMNLDYEQTGTTSEPQSGYSETLASNSYRGAKNSAEYYRMATDQDALTNAFNKIFENTSKNKSDVELDATHSLVRDVFSENFNFSIPTDASGNVTDNVTVMTYQCISFESDGTPYFSNEGAPLSPATVTYNTSTKTLDVKGYDFSDNYNLKGETPAEDHLGSKLVITIHDLTPNTVGDALYSNTATSGVYERTDDGGSNEETLLNQFPQPSISRHSYTLNVGSDNTAATFDYATKLVGSGGNLDDVIVVVPETVTEGGTTTTVEHRYPYSDFITNNDTGEFGNWGNGTVFYYENVPAGYTIHTSLKTDDNAYTYSVAYDDDQAGTQPRAMIPAQATVRDDFSFDDHQINITSEANTRNAFLTLTTEGLYANTERQFPIGMEITGYTGDITYKLNGSSSLTALHFSDGVLTNPPDDLKLKHGDQVEFTNLPANSTVTITPSDDPGNVYTWTAQLDSGEATGTAKEGTIDRDGHAFHVVYKRGTVTETGVSDDGSHSFTYILAGIGVLTGGAGAAYVYRKKDEFVER